MKAIRKLVTFFKIWSLVLKLRRAPVGMVLQTDLTPDEAGLASIKSGRWAMIYQVENITELQVLTK